MPLISVLGKLRQDYHEFKASLSYRIKTCFKKPEQARHGRLRQFKASPGYKVS